MVRLGIESRASCSASKNLTTTPSLFQSALQHNPLSVNHACQVSGFWGESLDLLKMTTDDGFGNYHKQSLLLIKDKRRLYQPFYCHKNRPIWWKYEANWEFTKSPPREEWKGDPPPLEVQHVCVNRYSRSLIWPRSIFFIEVTQFLMLIFIRYAYKFK